MFNKILIANRGEIACRVAATARRLGMATVAVYSEADAQARHVSLCDEAVRIGPAPARESYLCGDRIIQAALDTGAQAVHPGYGFLSENAEFAEACAAAGLVFIGPPPSAIRAMGSKSAAKALMEHAGVPLVPGYHGADQDPALLAREAARIGYPVLLKASAGGGGKGMRVVERAEDLASALASCRREAASAFGDDQVLVEKYLQRPRHIEIQVFADTLGQCVHLFERDCSVQRRHQKVLEEAPAPGMTAERRAAMGEAAVAAARAVGYVGAGTVEFIAETAGELEGEGATGPGFYFMEMNTRLQVEHPVTEMITGTDLVEWQLRVAAGLPLPLSQDQLSIHGHAIEARIYAEQPEKGFLPSIGTLRHVELPAAVQFQTGLQDGQPAAVRLDGGVRQGDAITPHYDPMIAKLIVWGADRTQAVARMARALGEVRITGLATNTAFLKRLVEGSSFRNARLDTGLIERDNMELLPPPGAAPAAALALASAALLHDEANSARTSSASPADPWSQTDGWRLNGRLRRQLKFTDDFTSATGAQPYTLDIDYRSEGWHLASSELTEPLCLRQIDGARMSVQLGAATLTGSVIREDHLFHVFTRGAYYALTWQDPLAHANAGEGPDGRLTAPMPGKIVALLAQAGQSVRRGDPLVIMEAMKMEHTILAPADGQVEENLYQVGDQVAEGAPLLVFAQHMTVSAGPRSA